MDLHDDAKLPIWVHRVKRFDTWFGDSPAHLPAVPTRFGVSRGFRAAAETSRRPAD
jgi:hypothetical protein